MATFRVKYTVIVEQEIEWPDDELDNVSYDNILLNCDIENAEDITYEEITDISKNGKYYEFANETKI